MPEIVYEDNHLLIVVKPPNQLTQSDSTGDISLQDELKEYLRVKYQKPGEAYLGLVHRLDRPVGGLVAFAKTGKAASRLSEQLRAKTMRRDYLAVVENEAALEDAGEIRSLLRKDDETGNVSTVSQNTAGAQEAILRYRVLERKNGNALVHVMLETGRKHQIRVQFASIGHPLLYDMRYGHGKTSCSIALWGSVLSLTHPTLKTPMVFTSSPRGEAFAEYQEAIGAFLAGQQNGEIL